MTLNSVAFFASRHPKVAAGLIITSEFGNAAIGLTLGSSLLTDLPGWYLALLLGGLVLIRVLFRRYVAIRLVDLVSGERFRFQKTGYTLLFLINFLAYIVAGGISGRAISHPEPSISMVGESYSSWSETSKKDSLSRLSATQPTSQTAVGTPEPNPHTGTRVGYFLLFLSSIFLAIASSSLACRLACANHGFAAVLVILLGMGILAGGIYFLGRLFDKNMKLYKEMTKAERKREGRRFWRTLLGTVAVLLLFFISAAVN